MVFLDQRPGRTFSLRGRGTREGLLSSEAWLAPCLRISWSTGILVQSFGFSIA